MIERTLSEWRDLLLKELLGRRPFHTMLRGYYGGIQNLPTAPSTATETYRRLAELGVTNMCGLVVDTVNERLRPQGVRLSTDAEADTDVWRRVWQANNLDADWSVAQEEALKVGRCPVLIWPDEKDEAKASVTVEDADEVIVAYEPGSRRRRVAALKSYTDGVTTFATVWTATEVQSWSRKGAEFDAASMGVDWDDDDDQTGPNKLARVPVVELLSKPSVKGVPMPELTPAVLHLQDRINKTMFDAVVAAEYGAFPQRYTIGVQVSRNPDGTVRNPLVVGPNRTWVLEQSDGQNATIGQLDPFPLDGLLALADASIKHLASISQTPVYYLLSGLTNVGADSIRAAETGHVAKIMNHQTMFGDAAEEMFRLALIIEGGVPPAEVEMVWAKPETRSPAELADAAIKLSQSGYPFVAIAKMMGESPTEIERLVAQRVADGVEAQIPLRNGAQPPAMGGNRNE